MPAAPLTHKHRFAIGSPLGRKARDTRNIPEGAHRHPRQASGQVAEWLKAADCKSARASVRWFESSPVHHLLPSHWIGKKTAEISRFDPIGCYNCSMKDRPMYLTKNTHGVYYYRRPITTEDQSFWRGPSGSLKKEWNKSLRTKSRPTAIERMVDAADLYETERAEQLARHGTIRATSAPLESESEREEREAAEAHRAAQEARREARRELRKERRLRTKMSTAELSPEEAAWHDLIRERDAELDELRNAVAGQRTTTAALAGRVPPARASSEGPTIDDLIASYETDKSPSWSGSSKKAVVPVFRVLRDVFPDRAITSITRQDARELVGLLHRLPTQIGKRKELAGLTVPEAVEKGSRLGLPTIAPKTINDGYLLHIASMWNWAVQEQWIASHPFRGLSVHDPVDDAERRDPFTADQLQALFASRPWTSPWQPGSEKPGAFWVPLLCLFHGLRNGEAAGLRVEDIGCEDGVPVFHIRAYDGKSVKTAGSRGTLPLHPELLQLGFMEHVAQRRQASELLLFPEGVPNARGQIAAKLAERFSRHIKKNGS